MTAVHRPASVELLPSTGLVDGLEAAELERDSVQNRNMLRYRGILIALGATLFLWATVAVTLWGALSLLR